MRHEGTHPDPRPFLVSQFETRSPIRQLSKRPTLRDAALAGTAELLYMQNLRKQVETFHEKLSRGYQGGNTTSSDEAGRHFDLAFEELRDALAIHALLEVPIELLSKHIQSQCSPLRHALADLVRTILAENVDSGVCGVLTLLSDQTLARTVFRRPYRPLGIDAIPLGEIVESEQPSVMWSHICEWSVDKTVVSERRGSVLLFYPQGRELLNSTPWFLLQKVIVRRGTQFTSYATPIDTSTTTGKTVDVSNQQIVCVSCFHFVLFQARFSDRVVRPSRSQALSWVTDPSRISLALLVIGFLVVMFGLLHSRLDFGSSNETQFSRPEAIETQRSAEDDSMRGGTAFDKQVEQELAELRKIRSGE